MRVDSDHTGACCRSSVSVCIAVFWLCTTAVGAELPVEVRDAQLQNAASLNRITVSWVKTSNFNLPIAEVRAKIGSDETLTVQLPFTVKSFTYQNGKIYQRYVMLSSVPGQEKSGKTIPLESEMSFDGTTAYNGSGQDRGPKEGDPSLVIMTRPLWIKRAANRHVLYTEYLERCGFDFDRTAADINVPPTSILLDRIRGPHATTTVGSDDVAGTRCTLVEVTTRTGKFTFALDPKLGYALRRLEQRNSEGNLMVGTINSSFVQLPGTQTWLPKLAETDWYTWHTMNGEVMNKPIFKTVIKVQTVSNDPAPAERFVLDYTRPNTRVHDSRLPGAEATDNGLLYYKMPADKARLDAVIAEARERQAGSPTQSRDRIRLIIIINLFVCATLCLAYAWARRGRKESKESGTL